MGCLTCLTMKAHGEENDRAEESTPMQTERKIRKNEMEDRRGQKPAAGKTGTDYTEAKCLQLFKVVWHKGKVTHQDQ